MSNLSAHQFGKYDSAYTSQADNDYNNLSEYHAAGGHEEVNEHLRTGNPPKPTSETGVNVRGTVGALKRATKPTTEDMTLYRAGSGNSDKGYMSATSHEQIASRFKDNGNTDLYAIHVPKGSPHVVPPGGAGVKGEVVLPPGKLNETGREGGKIKATYEPS